MKRALIAIAVLAACDAREASREAPAKIVQPAKPVAASGPIVARTGPLELTPVSGKATAERVRRGTIVLDGAPRAFWLRTTSEFDSPYTTIALDRNGDGVAGPPAVAAESSAQRKLREWDDPEIVELFEQTINLGDHSYDIAIDERGDQLTLTPRATRLPDRASLRAGATAPDFSIDAIDGTRIHLSGLRGRPVLLDFWSTTCVQCVQAMPQLAALEHRYHPQGLEIVGIASDTDDDLRRFLASHPHTGAVALDDDKVSAQYRVGWFPSYFLVDDDGKLAVSRGSLDDVAAHLARAHAAPIRAAAGPSTLTVDIDVDRGH